MDAPDEAPNYRPPPPPKDPPKRLDRPKITLQIPGPLTPRGPVTATSPHYWGPSRYRGRPPTTPGSHISDPHGNPYFNPFVHMYHNKASEFMFKQFEGFKDFTMNTAKSGLSAGEKSAFWFVNKLKILSKRWFTHLFLTLCLVLYSVMGAAMFYAIEGANEKEEMKNQINITDVRREATERIHEIFVRDRSQAHLDNNEMELLKLIETNLEQYAANYTEFVNQKTKKTWTFWNCMFYAGTIYTTIGEF